MCVILGPWCSLLSNRPEEKRMKRQRAAAVVEAARSPAREKRVGDVDGGRQPRRVHYFVVFRNFTSHKNEVPCISHPEVG